MKRNLLTSIAVTTLVAFVVLASGPSAQAASATWNGTTNALWSTTTNWSASPVPGVGDTATFDNAGSGNTTITVGTIFLSNITFDTINAAAYTLGATPGTGTITFADGTTTAVTMNSAVAANETINANLTLGTAIASTTTFQNDSTTNLLTLGGIITGGTGGTAAAKTVTIAGAGNTTIGGIISNGGATSVAVSKTGAGTLTLNGANTYTGGTAIGVGTLKLGNAAALGGSAGAVSVTSGAVLDLNGQAVANTNALTLNGSGIGATGALINSSNTAASYAGAINLGSASTIGSTGTGNIFTVGGAVTGAQNLTINAGGTQGITLASVNNTGTVTNSGAGTGTTIITALGSNVTSLTQAGASSLAVANAVALTASLKSFTSTGSGLFTLAAQVTGAQNLTLSANSTGNITLTLGANNGGSITNNGTGTNTVTVGAIGATVTGGVTQNATNSILLLNGAGLYTGGTTITAGTLQVGNATALGANTSAVSVASGGALDVNGITMTNTNALTINGTGISSGGALVNNNNSVPWNLNTTAGTYAGTVTMAGDSSIGGNGGTLNLTGIVGGLFNLTKVGTNTLVLSAANTFGGSGKTFTISGGTVQLATTTLGLGAANTAVSVTSGGTLDLNGKAYATNTPLTLNGGALINGITTGTLTFGYGVTLGADSSIGASGAGILTLNQIVSGNFNLTKIGTGTLVLSNAANTFGGSGKTFFINAGTVALGATTTSLGANGTAVSVASGAVLNLNGVTSTTTNPLTINGSGIGGTGALINTGVTASYSSNVTLASDSTIGITYGSGAITLSGNVTSTGTANLTLLNSSPVSLTLANVNNTGTVTNSGSGGTAAIITALGSNVTGLTEAGATPFTVTNAVGLTSSLKSFTSTGSGLFTLTGQVTGAQNLTLSANSTGNITLTNGANNGGSITNNGTGTGLVTVGAIGSTVTGGVTQNSANSTLLLNGANTYTGNTTISAGTLKVGSTTALGANATSASVATGAVLDLNGTTMANTYALTLSGTGISSGGALTNSGAAATYAGLVTLGSSNVSIGGNGTIGLTNTGSIYGTSTGYGLTLQGAGGSVAGSINGGVNGTPGAGTLTKTGTGTWTLSGNNTYTGVTTISAGTLQFAKQLSLYSNTPASWTAANIKVAGTGTLALNVGGSGEFTTANVTTLLTNLGGGNGSTSGGFAAGSAIGFDTTGGNFTVGDTLADSTGTGGGALGVTKLGTNTLTLTHANTYTGPTTISAGTLTVGNATALSAGTVTVASGATLDLNGTSMSNALTLNGGTLSSQSPATYSGLITLGGNSTIAALSTPGGTLTISNTGTITGAYGLTLNAGAGTGNSTLASIIGTGNGTLTKTGSGLWILTAANTFSGNTLVSNNGVLALGNALALQNSAIDTSGTGNFTLSVTTPTIGGLVGSKDLASVLLTGYSSVTALTLNPGAGITDTYSGAIANGSMALTKTGLGTQVLTGTNSYSGATTISAGTLQFGKTASLYNSVTGNWTAANIKVASTGTLALSVGGTGDFSTGNVTTLLTNLGGSNGTSSTGFAAGSAIGFDTTGGNFAVGDIIANSSGTGGGALGLTKLGTNTLTLTGNSTYTGPTIISAGTLQIGNASDSGSIETTSAITDNGVLTYNVGAGNRTVSAAISGTGSITQNGTGILALSGANSFTGNVTLNTGTLALNNASALGTSAGALIIAGSTTLDNTSGAAITLTGNKTVTLNGDFAFTGTKDLNLGNGAVSLGSAVGTSRTITSNSGNLTIGGIIANGTPIAATLAGTAGNATTTYTLTTAGGALVGQTVTGTGVAGGTTVIAVSGTTVTLSIATTAAVTNATFTNAAATSIIKAGNGALTLAGANTFTGGVTLNTGTLNINNAAALGTTAGTFVIAGGTIGNTSGVSITSANNPQTWNGDFAFTGAGLTTALYDLSMGTGAVSLGTTAGTSRTITVNSGTIYEGGIIANGTTANSLIKAGTGALTLAGANTFTGGVTLNTGTLNINNANALGAVATSTLTINGGTLGQTANAGSGGSNGLVTSNYVQVWNGNFGFTVAPVTSGFYNGFNQENLNLGTGAVSLGTTAGPTRTITVGGTDATNGYYANLTIGGVISNGSNGTPATGLIKNGAGVLTLNGANLFTGGVTLNAGTLQIGNAAALGTTAGTLTINGGSLAISAATTLSNYAQAWNSSFSIRPSIPGNTGFTLTMGTGAITLGNNVTVTTTNGALNVGGAIGDGSNTYGVTWVAGLNASPAITLTGASTYHGPTVVQSQSGSTISQGWSGGFGYNVTMATGTLANTSGVTVNGNGYFNVGSTATSTNLINPLATLTIGGNGGGYYNFVCSSTAANKQTFASLTVGSGDDVLYTSGNATTTSQFTFTGANPYLRSVGGVARFLGFDSNTKFTNAPSGTGNVIGSGATAMLVGAVSATATMLDASNFVLAPSAGGGLTALTSAANSWGTGINTAVAAGSTAPGALSQSLSFAAGGSLTLPGAFTVESGGILVTSTPTIPVTITGGTIKTGISGGDLWIVQSGSGMAGGQLVDPTHGLIINSQIIDNGGSSLTKVGARGLYLTNTNNTYTGGTFLAEGTLNVASAGSLGIGGALNFTGNAAFQAAGNVDLGTRAVNIGTGLVATIDTNSNNITVGGVISGVNSALTKTGLGTLTLTGNNTYTGITTVNNGSLKLDFSASGAPQNNIINSNSILNLGSLACVDSLIIQGAAGVANIQTFGATPSPLNNTGATNFLGGMNNLVFNAGTGGSLTVNLGNITLAGAAYMDVTTSGNVTVAGVNATSASLYLDKAFVNSGGNSNAWATVNKSTWATANSSGNLVGWANSAYQTNFTGAIGSSNQMYDITTSGTLSSQYTGAAATLRFNDTLNTGVGKTVTLVGTQVTQLLMGGILVTSNVGAQDSTITGGFLTGANLTRLGIFQNNTAGNLIINSTIVDQANGCNVTKNGAGTVILNGVNSNTVGIIVNEGTLIATGDYMPSSVKTITTTAGSNVVTMSDTTGLFVGQELMGNTPGLTVVNGGLPNVVTAINPGVSVTLTTYAQASNTLSATFTSGGAIGGAAPTAVNLVLPTTYIANGATLQIGSAATGNHGGIDPNVTINNQGALILSHSGPYTFGNTIIGAPVNNSAVGNLAINSLVGTNATNTLEITGGGTTTLGFYGIVNGSGAGGQKIYTLATPGNVYAGMSVTGTGIPGGTVVSYVDGVNVGLTNAISTGGATNATFQTANTFNGATRITGGSTLTLGSNLALQYSTLLYNNSDSGTFSFGTQTAVTLGGLAGDKNLALTNAASAAVALTVGGVYNSNTVTNNFNTTYSGILSGNGSLTKNGIGITTLSGANTYSGGTTVTAGTLQLGNASALGASAGAVSVASGATLDVNATMTNTNALTLNGQGYSIAALTNTSASPATYAGTVAMASDTNIGGSNGTLTLGGIVSGTFNLTKVGTDTLIFGNVANTFGTGKTFSIVAGTVQLGNAASLGAATNAVSLRDGAALDLYGQTVANTNALTLNGTGISSGGALTNTSATGASYAGLITLGSASSIIAGSGNITISNVATIAGPTFGLTLGGAYNGSLASIIGTTTGSLTKQDAGTWTLSGANTYTGATTISAGTLKLGVAGALGNATTHTSGVTVSATGALDLNGFTPTATTVALTLNGSGVSNGGALTNSGSAATYGGTVALATASTIGATSSSSSITLTGVISGAGGLTKVGADTLYLNGNNTFTGNVTINGGEVRLGNAGALNNTPGSENAVAFGSGSTGTLSLNGNNVTIANLTTDPTTPGTTIVQNMSGTNTLTVGNSLNLSGTYAGTIQEIGVLALTKAGTGTLTLTGTNTYTGTTTISAGTLQLGTGGQLTSSAIVNNANFAINSTGVVQQGNELSSAAITGTGTFTQAGTGTTTLNAANAFLGKTIVQNGTLSFTTGSATATAAQSLGANAALDLGVASTSSGILKYTGTGNATLAKNINVLGNGSDTIQNSTTSLLTLTGTITKNGTVLTLKGGTGGITVSGTGTIAGSNAGSDLVVDGGNVTLSTANTYNGPTSIINGATLTANATGALPTAIRSAVSIDQTGSGTSTLALGASQSAASLTGNLTSKVTLGSNTLTLGMTGNSTTTFAGVISGTNGNVIKDGTSIQVFSGNNTYTGTTAVNEGTLEAAAAGALGATSAITVTNTGTLLLSANAATSNSTTLTLNGGKVELKTGPSVSTSLGALTLTDTSIIDFGLSSTNNILTLGAVTSWTSTKTIEIWNWSGTPFFGGGSERLMVSDTTGWTTNLGSINFFTDSGTTLIGGGGAMFAGYELVAVPEPATWSYMAAIALGGAALLIRRRRLIGRLKY